MHPEYTNNFYNSTKKKDKYTTLKIGKGPEWIFLQSRYTNDQYAHEKNSTSLVTREMQIKTSEIYHFMPTKMTKVKKTDKCWQGCGEI